MDMRRFDFAKTFEKMAKEVMISVEKELQLGIESHVRILKMQNFLCPSYLT